MHLDEMIEQLFEKDTRKAYSNLQELEKISESGDALYPYFDQFLKMIKSDKYVIRVRGFRLLSKQAKWDKDKKVEKSLDEILTALNDEKPTAVRQILKALEDVATYRPELRDRVRKRIVSMDCRIYNKETMRGLIEKDIARLIRLIDLNRQ